MTIIARGAAALVLALVLHGCGGGGSSSTGGKTPVAERFPIDGVVSLSAVGAVHAQSVDLKDTLGTGSAAVTTTLRWAAQNDDRNLYLALEWSDATQNAFYPEVALDDFDGVAVAIDGDGDGLLEEGEEVKRLVMTHYGSSFSDLHVHGSDPVDDRVGDGMGRMTYDAAAKRYQAEFLIPIAADTNGEDPALGASARINIVLYDHIQIALVSGNMGALHGAAVLAAGVDASGWTALLWSAASGYAQPSLPSGLGGRVVFISDDDNSNGELYTFSPATGAVTRVTHDTGLYMDGASLSHDRTRIAFYGAVSKTDYAAYEIYTVNVDGTDLTQVTSNALLDGHPAWSPDDSRLAFASFREGGKASIIVSDTAGTELADLTPAGANDNDPEWLPDGRLLFKTDRFGTAGSPQLRIAVMNSDGSGVQQVTNSAGTSDHDPTGTNGVVFFERFTKETDYSTDPSSAFAPWNIIAATFGGGERTLLADGWVNWLPVPDPSGGYLAYLKSVGYTEVRLMTAQGEDLGRLIPGNTTVRYLDWK